MNVVGKQIAFEDSLQTVLSADFAALVKARRNYGESWCKRGGVGAFMMLARKWDRLENYLSNPPGEHPEEVEFDKFDILTAAAADKRAEGVIDDIRDLRRYLVLAEAKLIEMGVIHGHVEKDIVHDVAIAPVPGSRTFHSKTSALDRVKHETDFTEPQPKYMTEEKKEEIFGERAWYKTKEAAMDAPMTSQEKARFQAGLTRDLSPEPQPKKPLDHVRFDSDDYKGADHD